MRPSRRGAVFYISRADGHVLVRTREARGLLGGMTEIPGTAWTDDKGALHMPIGEKHGTTVEVREFHGKTLIDGVRSWVQKSLNV